MKDMCLRNSKIRDPAVADFNFLLLEVIYANRWKIHYILSLK